MREEKTLKKAQGPGKGSNELGTRGQSVQKGSKRVYTGTRGKRVWLTEPKRKKDLTRPRALVAR